MAAFSLAQIEHALAHRVCLVSEHGRVPIGIGLVLVQRRLQFERPLASRGSIDDHTGSQLCEVVSNA